MKRIFKQQQKSILMAMMKSSELRRRFSAFFTKDHGHLSLPSSPLVPEAGYSSLLFTNAGMVQFKDAFLGLTPPKSSRITTIQKCMRAGGKHNDLENVGFTDRHHTFFEMLGNFSFNDYYKEEAIVLAHSFLVKEIGISEKKLRVTVLEGDAESEKLWKSVLSAGTPVHRLGADDNFWSMGDAAGLPCGPCSEIFYDRGDCFEDRYLEIWNLVFMQNIQDGNGGFTDLPKKCVDTGMGLERIASVLQCSDSNFETDLFVPLISATRDILKDDKNKFAERIIADHLRAAAFLIADGVTPSNVARGYVLRRIIRRAVGFAHKAGITQPFMYRLLPSLVSTMDNAYPELQERQMIIKAVIMAEESIFYDTLDRGMSMLQKAISQGILDPEFVFKMYDTYGFPIDLTESIARENGIIIDLEQFDALMQDQRNRSTSEPQVNDDHVFLSALNPSVFTGYETLVQRNAAVIATTIGGWVAIDKCPFYPKGGGQVGDIGHLVLPDGSEVAVTDTGKSNTGTIVLHVDGKLNSGDVVDAFVDPHHRNRSSVHHTATHLLHAALRQTLGDQVLQAGSQVDATKLRFDISHPRPLDSDQIAKIELLVNDNARSAVAVVSGETDLESAKKQNAMMLFGEKYDKEKVRIVSIGSNSLELCGGTHVQNSLEVFPFKIISDTSVAAGTRRIEAVSGVACHEWLLKQSHDLESVASLLQSPPCLVDHVSVLAHRAKSLDSEVKRLKKRILSTVLPVEAKSQYISVHRIPDLSPGDGKATNQAIRMYRDLLQAQQKDVPVHFILCGSFIACSVNDVDIGNANTLITRCFVDCSPGSGGGNATFAQGQFAVAEFSLKISDKIVTFL